jgi:hypothetical protein
MIAQSKNIHQAEIDFMWVNTYVLT